MHKDKLVINILLKQYYVNWKTIRNITTTEEKSIKFGLTVISIGLAYGIRYDLKEILIFLPMAIAVVLLFGIDKSTELQSLGGYNKFLEEELNKKSDKKYLCWESHVAKERHTNITQIFLYVIYIIFFIISIFISLYTALSYSAYWFLNILIFIGILIINLFLIVAFIISLCKMRNSFDEIYLKNKKINEITD